MRAERQRKVGELVLATEPLTELAEAARTQVLVNLVRRKGLELLPWTPEVRQWQSRVAFLRELDVKQGGQSLWPDLNDVALIGSLEASLQPYLNNVSRLSHFGQLEFLLFSATFSPGPYSSKFK